MTVRARVRARGETVATFDGGPRARARRSGRGNGRDEGAR